MRHSFWYTYRAVNVLRDIIDNAVKNAPCSRAEPVAVGSVDLEEFSHGACLSVPAV
jgi:hypothetical protein